MSRTDAPRTADVNNLPDIRLFADRVAAYRAGQLTPDEFKPVRALWGVHQQKQKDRYFLRVRAPGGVLLARQLDVLARVAERHSQRPVHVTTRQDFQVYFLELKSLAGVLEDLAKAGLSGWRAAGPTVRNVTTCPMSGLCPAEAFDVVPFAEALTKRYLRSPLAERLPRKFKVALSGCSRDCAVSAIHDVGAVAEVRDVDGRPTPGFRLMAGGGLGLLPRAGQELGFFVPHGEFLSTVEAILRVYAARGERTVRGRARMKFLLERMGRDAFEKEVLELRAALPPEGRGVPAPEREASSDGGAAGAGPPEAGYSGEEGEAGDLWLQKQPGFVTVVVPLPLGDITPAQLRTVSEVSRMYGRFEARTTADQDMAVPWISWNDLPKATRRLREAGLGVCCQGRACNPTCCAGGDTCASAFTKSRALAARLREFFEGPEGRALKETAGRLRIGISGCPNGCGRHRVADIGLAGFAQKAGGALCPMYRIFIGGRAENGRVDLGRSLGAVPARRALPTVAALLSFYRDDRKPGESFQAFAARMPTAVWEGVVRDWQLQEGGLPAPEERRDIDSDEPYSFEDRSSEC